MNRESRNKATSQDQSLQAFAACQRGDIEELQRLLDAGVSVESKNLFDSLLSEAVRCKQHGLVDLLISRGANLNERNGALRPVIVMAVVNQDLQMVRKLTAAGADVRACLPNGDVPVLGLAALIGSREICVELIKSGAEWWQSTTSYDCALGAILEIDDGSILEAISSQPDWVEKKTRAGLTLAHIASWNGHIDYLKRAVEAGASIDVPDGQCGHTVLHWAFISDRENCVEYLLSVGASMCAKSVSNFTPLEAGIVSKKAHTVVSYLISRCQSPLAALADPACTRFHGQLLENLFSDSEEALATLAALSQPIRSMSSAKEIENIVFNAIAPLDDFFQQPCQSAQQGLPL